MGTAGASRALGTHRAATRDETARKKVTPPARRASARRDRGRGDGRSVIPRALPAPVRTVRGGRRRRRSNLAGAAMMAERLPMRQRAGSGLCL
jgi:hypothetical protein